MIKLVDLNAQHEELIVELLEAVKKVVSESSFIGADSVLGFEKSFAAYCNIEYAVGISNGTTALEVALKGCGISAGDEVITVANTFFATAEAIYNVGAIPIFIDVNILDGLMDTSKIEENIGSRTKAIIPVHLFGNLVNMPEVMRIADKYKLFVIEDAAQAHGASSDWGVPGSLSVCATYSFYPGKNLGAWGDAGAIVTNDEAFAKRVSKIRDHGRISKYAHDLIGVNARMDGLQSSILEVKLRALSKWNRKRQEVAERYIKSFSTAGFKVLSDPTKYSPSWHLFVLRVSNRNEIQDYFKSRMIETGIHYPIPLHKQPAIADQYLQLSLPVTELLAQEIISLPIHPHLTSEQIEEVIKEFLIIAKNLKL
jgi:dTDP-4-amino-4,6-dideoxygalactose transaminase